MDIKFVRNVNQAVSIIQIRIINIRIEIQYGVTHTHTLKWPGQITFFSLVIDAGRTVYFRDQGTHQIFGQVNQVIVVRISLVKFKHGKFRIMSRR